MRTAVFPGSFDPFTLGHMDVLTSALKLFDSVIVAVGYNHLKHGFLHPDQRVRLISDSIRPLASTGADIEVVSYSGLTVDLCRKHNAEFIIRGLRTTTDFELESVIAQANRKMSPETVTVFIPASHEYSFISSTVVRDVIINGGDASSFLPSGIDIKNYM
ncbi:MAG TPA: pantetheine-phosphate adenylyltransferase [Candidatus Coprenecus pullistercoris]|nr:pantetheine-phosphate adenylyltransferase [Candidatus Coprenecus pullistercoris]